MESKKKTLSKIVIASAVFLMLSLCIVPASADNDVFTDNNKTYVGVSNDAGARFNIYDDNTYYYIFKKPDGGLRAIHITNDTDDLEGDTYSFSVASNEYSDTFYITDTSLDTQYHDNAILMFAIPYSNLSLAQNMELTITASGYNWTPTGDGSKPLRGELAYQAENYSETFDRDDFLVNTSAWRPAGYDDYPVYEDQEMSENEQFKFMFIDLYLGTLNETGYNPSLTDKGSIMVNYTISNYSGAAAFDVYGFKNQSNQGQGVSWTNKLLGDKSSGWKINL